MSSRVQTMIVAAVVASALAGGAHADPLNPLDYASLGTLNIATTANPTYIDSDALTLTVDHWPSPDPDTVYYGVAVSQAGGPEIAVFTFSDINIGADVVARAGGARPIALLSHNEIIIDGLVRVRGMLAVYGIPLIATGGPGGWAGGLSGDTGGQPGEGPGGGGAAAWIEIDREWSLGGGGGYGGPGQSGVRTPAPPPTGGVAYGDLFTVLQGGSGGGGGWHSSIYASGGGGGGAIEIGAVNNLVLSEGAYVDASGGGGDFFLTHGGGGSGGGIILHAAYLDLRGSILAEGGAEAERITPSSGVSGGGGRVLLETPSLYVGSGQLSTAAVSVAGGAGWEDGGAGVFDVSVGEVIVPTGETLTMIDGTPVGLFPDGWSPRIDLYRVAGTGRLVSEGATTIPALTTSGLTQVLSGALAVDGPGGLSVQGGTVEVSSGAGLSVAQHMDVGGAGTVHLLGPLTGGTATNAGQINVVGTTASFSGNVVNNATGEISGINATLGFPGDGIKNDVGLVNQGQLNLIGVVVNGDVHSPSGSAINVATEVVFNGLVSGAGNFPGAGLVTFNGGYEPGDSIAGVSFMGDVQLGAGNTLRMELGGTTAGSGHDQLNVTGGTSLDGTLAISLIDPFTPQVGGEFEIMTYASRSGEFADTTGWLFDDKALVKIYGPDALTLVATYQGDATLDFCVDGLDYVAWSNNYLTGDTWQKADFNDDGITDGLDYVIWSNNYWSGCPGVPGPVPEPSSALLLALGALGFRRRSRA